VSTSGWERSVRKCHEEGGKRGVSAGDEIAFVLKLCETAMSSETLK
jgi:hypothetical protein